MRSYKNNLVEYLEELGYSDLNYDWAKYLNNRFNDLENFQLIVGVPPILGKNNLKYFADLIPSKTLIQNYQLFSQNKFSKVYEKKIKELLENELNSLKILTKNRLLNWSPNEVNSNSFKDFVLKSLIGFDESNEAVSNFLKFSHKNIQVIDDYFNPNNYFLDRPNYSIKELDLIARLPINFVTEKDIPNDNCNWTKNVIDKNHDFFHSNTEDLVDVNALAKICGVKVKGSISGIKMYSIEVGKWFNKNAVLNEEFVPKQFKYSRFITAEEFDISIEINNEFNDHQIEHLRRTRFSVFPFHLNENHIHNKWIEKTESGSLKITIKSNEAQQTLIAASLNTI